jgi:hypothetical protein
VSPLGVANYKIIIFVVITLLENKFNLEFSSALINLPVDTYVILRKIEIKKN